MNSLQKTGRILATVFSFAFALFLLPQILGDYGIVKSLVLALSGIGAIWAVYFVLGGLFRFIYDEGLREQASGERNPER